MIILNGYGRHETMDGRTDDMNYVVEFGNVGVLLVFIWHKFDCAWCMSVDTHAFLGRFLGASSRDVMGENCLYMCWIPDPHTRDGDGKGDSDFCLCFYGGLSDPY